MDLEAKDIHVYELDLHELEIKSVADLILQLTEFQVKYKDCDITPYFEEAKDDFGRSYACFIVTRKETAKELEQRVLDDEHKRSQKRNAEYSQYLLLKERFGD